MTRRLGISAAISALVAAAFTTISTPPAGAADPMLGAPTVGQCFDLSVAELAEPAYPEAAVDCAASHTAQTIAVTTIPDGMDYSGNRFFTFALETCYRAQRKAIGTNLVSAQLTAYSIGFFGPTTEQQAGGARWLRCDLILVDKKNLLPLPGDVEVGDSPFRDEVARCLAGRDFEMTVCAKRHTFRATGAVKVRGTRYPSEKAWSQLGAERCRSRTSSRSYRYSWPSKLAWKAGNKTLVCYTKTRR